MTFGRRRKMASASNLRVIRTVFRPDVDNHVNTGETTYKVIDEETGFSLEFIVYDEEVEFSCATSDGKIYRGGSL
jgi:hypothetical protein